MVPPAKRPEISAGGPRVALLGALSRRRPQVVSGALLAFATVFALRFAVGTTGDAITFLYVVPVAVIAISLGERGGLLAAAFAFLLASVWVLVEHPQVTALGYLVRAAVFLLIGGLVGRFADELRALEAESARHFELSLDLVCIAGFDGCFKRVNPAFERTLGYLSAELVGRPFLDFVHPDDRERTEREAGAIADGNGTVQFQNRYLDKAGEVHWLEWTSVPIASERLIYAVARDVTERKALEAELQRLSQRDPLTGLFNRRRFDEELERQLSRTERYGDCGALLLLDLDRFKSINDELGHAAGDEALHEVSRILRENLRRADAVIARLGGDEFVALLSPVDGKGAQAAAQRLVDGLQALTLTIEGREVRLGASIGVALFHARGRPRARELFAAADKAMYEAKAKGGGRVTVAEDGAALDSGAQR